MIIIKNSLLLIVIINKIYNFIKLYKQSFITFIDKNKEYENIFIFICDIYDFCNNCVDVNNNFIKYNKYIKLNIFDKFLDDFVNFLIDYYKKI